MQSLINDEIRGLMISLWGSDAWRVGEHQVQIGSVKDAGGIPRSATEVDGKNVRIFWAEPGNLPALAHEWGHAIHATIYPESVDWPTWKAEGFALLADVRANRFLHLSDIRSQFARHMRAVRNEGTADHKAGLLLAWQAGKIKRLNDQKAFIANA